MNPILNKEPVKRAEKALKEFDKNLCSNSKITEITSTKCRT